MNYLWAFVVGGAICVVGQLLIDYTKLSPARILTGYVVAGVILSAVGLYDPLVKLAGAGASVPLLGFGHLLAQGVVKAVDECGLHGAFNGGLTAASGGIAASLIFGVLAALCVHRRHWRSGGWNYRQFGVCPAGRAGGQKQGPELNRRICAKNQYTNENARR